MNEKGSLNIVEAKNRSTNNSNEQKKSKYFKAFV